MPGARSPLLILIAGPYRSGTDDDPAGIRRNMRAMDAGELPHTAPGAT